MAGAMDARGRGASVRAALLVAGLVALLGVAAPRSCALYVLGKGSEVVEGCFEPCQCPARIAGDLRGIFLLEPLPAEPLAPIRSFDVRWVLWSYDHALGDGPTLVNGRGTYEVGGEFAIAQRLALDLRVGDEPVTRYDSGSVAGGSDTEEFPPIEISIARNGQYCYDRVFTLRAAPLRWR